MGVGGRRHAPSALPPGKTRYPLYRRLGGTQDRSGRVRKMSPRPGFDTWTVQPLLITDVQNAAVLAGLNFQPLRVKMYI